MKRCGWVKRQITAYAGGELGGRKRLAVEHHLKSCPECREEYQREGRVMELLQAEMAREKRESGAALAWETIQPSLEKETRAAEGEKRWAQTAEDWWMSFKEAFSPGAARTFSEAVYWGKRACVPALAMLLAVILYHALRPSPGVPVATSTTPVKIPLTVRINFGPNDARLPEGYYSNTGAATASFDSRKIEIRWGWQQTKSTDERGDHRVG